VPRPTPVFDAPCCGWGSQASSQEDVFEALDPLLRGALSDGGTCTVVIYGGPGSGKSHTMLGRIGDLRQQGIVPRAIALMAEAGTAAEGAAPTAAQAAMDVSFFEVLGDCFFDLSRDGDNSSTSFSTRGSSLQRLRLADASASAGHVAVEGLAHIPCSGSSVQALNCYLRGLERQRRNASASCFQVACLRGDGTHRATFRFVEIAAGSAKAAGVTSGPTSSPIMVSRSVPGGSLRGGLRSTSRGAASRSAGGGCAVSGLERALSARISGTSAGAAYRGSLLAEFLRPSFEGEHSGAFVLCVHPDEAHASTTALTLRLPMLIQQLPPAARRPGVAMREVEGVATAKPADIPDKAGGCHVDTVAPAQASDALPCEDAGREEHELPELPPAPTGPPDELQGVAVAALSSWIAAKRSSIVQLERERQRTEELVLNITSALDALRSSRQPGDGPCERETNLKLFFERTKKDLEKLLLLVTERTAQYRRFLESWQGSASTSPVPSAVLAAEQQGRFGVSVEVLAASASDSTASSASSALPVEPVSNHPHPGPEEAQCEGRSLAHSPEPPRCSEVASGWGPDIPQSPPLLRRGSGTPVVPRLPLGGGSDSLELRGSPAFTRSATAEAMCNSQHDSSDSSMSPVSEPDASARGNRRGGVRQLGRDTQRHSAPACFAAETSQSWGSPPRLPPSRQAPRLSQPSLQASPETPQRTLARTASRTNLAELKKAQLFGGDMAMKAKEAKVVAELLQLSLADDEDEMLKVKVLDGFHGFPVDGHSARKVPSPLRNELRLRTEQAGGYLSLATEGSTLLDGEDVSNAEEDGDSETSFEHDSIAGLAAPAERCAASLAQSAQPAPGEEEVAATGPNETGKTPMASLAQSAHIAAAAAKGPRAASDSGPAVAVESCLMSLAQSAHAAVASAVEAESTASAIAAGPVPSADADVTSVPSSAQVVATVIGAAVGGRSSAPPPRASAGPVAWPLPPQDGAVPRNAFRWRKDALTSGPSSSPQQKVISSSPQQKATNSSPQQRATNSSPQQRATSSSPQQKAPVIAAPPVQAYPCDAQQASRRQPQRSQSTCSLGPSRPGSARSLSGNATTSSPQVTRSRLDNAPRGMVASASARTLGRRIPTTSSSYGLARSRHPTGTPATAASSSSLSRNNSYCPQRFAAAASPPRRPA